MQNVKVASNLAKSYINHNFAYKFLLIDSVDI